jgi:hypothetical protein
VPDPTRLFVVGDGGVGVADTSRLESLAWVGPDLVSRPDRFIDGMLEPLTLFLVGAQDRQPVHAAAVARGGAAILLAGPSGAGKSTLAYALVRTGFALLADEPTYVQLEPRLRVWGRRPRIHLAPDAVRHFPELEGIPPTRLPSGKTKIVLDRPGGRRTRYAERAGVCLLRRGGAPALERTSPEEVVAELMTRLDPGFDLFAGTIGERIRRVAEGGAWHLTVGDSPDEVLPLLEEVACDLERRP